MIGVEEPRSATSPDMQGHVDEVPELLQLDHLLRLLPHTAGGPPFLG